jgi:hypothetical protein
LPQASLGAGAAGGGIYSVGSLTLEGCTIPNNQAVGGQGGHGHQFIDRAGGRDTTAGYGGNGLGGGLYTAGRAVSLHNSTITGNSG